MKLTKRQRDIIERIHLSNRQIGVELYLAEGTIKTHVHDLIKVFGAKNRTHLAVIYWQSICNDSLWWFSPM